MEAGFMALVLHKPGAKKRGLPDARAVTVSISRGCTSANEITSADGGWRVLFAVVALWPAAAEFRCQRVDAVLVAAWPDFVCNRRLRGDNEERKEIM
jgi:hypothetical protein